MSEGKRSQLRSDVTAAITRRGVVYGLLTAGLIGGLVLVLLALTAVFGSLFGVSNPLPLILFIVILLLVFDPIRRRLQDRLDALLFKQPLALDELLRDYNRELTTAISENQVASMLLLYVRTGLPATNPDLYLPNRDMSAYRSNYQTNELVLGADSPLVAYFKRAPGAIDVSEESAWPAVFVRERESVAAMDTAVIVPMYNDQDLLGWLSVPAKVNGERFNQVELAYLDALADQSLIGFERAAVVRRLEVQVKEQDLLSQFSQTLNFTIELDDMLELIFVNYQRLFDLHDLTIFLRDAESDATYAAFHVEAGERQRRAEGSRHRLHDERLQSAYESGQFVIAPDAHDCTWMAAPLNAGAEAIGIIVARYVKPGMTLRPRQQQLFKILADQSATSLARLQTNRQLETRARQLEIINEVTFTLATTMELGPLLELILEKAIELLDTEAGTFMESDLDTGELVFRVVRGPASSDLIGKRLPIGAGLAGTAAQTGQPVIVDEVHDDDRWFAKVDEESAFMTRSILTVPLLRYNTVWGVLQLINKRNGAAFNEDDQSLLTTFASQAVVAMENARLLAQTDEALRESVNELSLLTQLDRDLNSTLELRHVINLALQRTLSICRGDAGAVVLLQPDGEPYQVITEGYDDRFAVEAVTATTGLVGQVIASERPLLTDNVHEVTDYVPARFATQSQMTMPLVNKQQLIGVMVVESDEVGAFDEKTLETAVRVANHSSGAIANAVLVQQVNEANRAKSEFVSMVSHELKTPMTSMKGYTDLMLSGMTGELNEQQKTFLETIAANIRRMSQQIQDLTDISRIETGQLHISPVPVSFIQIVNETMQIVQGPCDEKEIRLRLSLPDDLPLVLADRARLVQVLTNLVSNGCKYSPPGTEITLCFEPRLTAVENGTSGTPLVMCAVSDQGYGISESDQQQLFTKFFRSNDPNIRQSKGTGLGLSITRGIVEAHDGEIWVESAVGNGTTFYFTVPQAAN